MLCGDGQTDKSFTQGTKRYWIGNFSVLQQVRQNNDNCQRDGVIVIQ